MSRFLKNESGATAIEYGLIAVVLVAALQLLGGSVQKAVEHGRPAAIAPEK